MSDSLSGQSSHQVGRQQKLANLLSSIEHDEALLLRVRGVLEQLPDEVVDDFTNDSRFSITRLNRQGGAKQKFWIAFPSSDGEASRCVVLKERLSTCQLNYSQYIIAHELAHAFLRNGVWKHYTDIEESADALAAHWGFAKPRLIKFR